jgi:urocanate hydratase
MVIVAPGTPEKAERSKRLLTTDPGIGIFRHADAGYELAQRVALERWVKIPGRE